MDEKEILLLLGEIKGNQEAQGKQTEKFEDQLKETNANIGKIVKVCSERTPAIERMEAHIKEDRPIGELLGKHALKVILFLAGAIGLWLVDRVPRIIELLR